MMAWLITQRRLIIRQSTQRINFNYAMLTILQDARAKPYKRYRKFLAATCVAAASRRGYAKHRLIKFKGSSRV